MTAFIKSHINTQKVCYNFLATVGHSGSHTKCSREIFNTPKRYLTRPHPMQKDLYDTTTMSRIDILRCLQGIQLSHFSSDSKLNLSQELNSFFNTIPILENTDTVTNMMYSLDTVKNTCESKPLDNANSKLLEEFIQRQVFKYTDISAYRMSIIKEHKITEDKHIHYKRRHRQPTLLSDLNIIFEVIPVAQSILFKQILENKKTPNQIQLNIGKTLLTRFQALFDDKKLNNRLWEKDLLVNDNIDFILNNLLRNTPAICYLGEHFRGLHKEAGPSYVTSRLAYLVILIEILEKMKPLILSENLCFSELAEPWQKLLTCLYYILMKKSFSEKTHLLPSLKLCPSDKFVPVLLNTLRIKILNVLTVYTKQLGLEFTQIYVNQGIITEAIKGRNGRYTLKIDLTHIRISSQLPDLLSSERKGYLSYQQKVGDKKFVKFNVSDIYIHNEQMESNILDADVWFGSAGRLSLNLEFIKDFLYTFNAILDQANNGKIEGLSYDQVSFLNAFYNINLHVLGKDSVIFTKIIAYAVDFKNLSKLVITSSTIPERILKKFVDTIYQKKFTLIYLVRDLPFLLCVKSFTLNFMFDGRGRAIPKASLFNHHHPVLRYFFSWGTNYELSTDDRLSCWFLLCKQTRACSKLNVNLQKDETPVDLMHMIQFGAKKKLFEATLLYKDLVNIHKLHIPTQFYYSVDASSSGVQINAMLIKSRKLALACGLIKNVPNENLNERMSRDRNYTGDTFWREKGNNEQLEGIIHDNKTYLYPNQGSNINDLYSLFLTYFYSNIENMHSKVEQLEYCDLSSINSLLIAVKEFIKVHFYRLNSMFYSYLKTESGLFDAFHNLYKMLDLVPEQDLMEIEVLVHDYKLKYPASKIYKLVMKKAQQQQKEVSPKKKVSKNKQGMLKGLFKMDVLLKFIEWEHKVISIQEFYPFLHLVNRKLVKHAIMITFYGGSGKSRRASFVDSCIDQAMEDNVLFTKAEERLLHSFSSFLDSEMTTWIKTEYPEAMYLINIIKEGAKKGIFEPQRLNNEHFSWLYRPMTSTKYTKSFYNKDYRLHRYTEKVNYRRLGSAFMANYIQYCDAAICSYIIHELTVQGIPILTSHDCFKCPYQFSGQLNIAIHNAYTRFFTDDWLNKHFAVNNSFILDALATLKKDNNVETFSVDDISNDTLVKF